MRGLDYYTGTVFEWTTDRLGAQGTVCAGGRYDTLVEQLGGRSVPAAGFALGIERLISLLESEDLLPPAACAHACLLMVGDAAVRHGLQLAERLRDEIRWLRLETLCGGGSLRSQFRRADRTGAGFALVLGDDELRDGVVSIKPLRQDVAQEQVALDALPKRLIELVAATAL